MLPSSHAAKSLVQLSGFAAVLLLLAAALCDARLQESESLLEDQRSLQGEQDNSIPLADKRAPSGFMGMRGKKNSYMLVDRRPEEDEYYQEWAELEPELGGQRDKKAPAGFMGMRGKKAPSGFLGLRGKKEVPQNLNELLLALSNRYRNSYGYKRAPLGFLGMRGRRSDPSMVEVSEDFETQKRAPYGFMGMRG